MQCSMWGVSVCEVVTFLATQSVHLPIEVRRSRNKDFLCVCVSIMLLCHDARASEPLFKSAIGGLGATSLEWCSTFPILTIKQASNIWDDFLMHLS